MGPRNSVVSWAWGQAGTAARLAAGTGTMPMPTTNCQLPTANCRFQLPFAIASASANLSSSTSAPYSG
eukprot:scaffold236613_cov33-Tisochrysis_lutea.AAC.1